MELRKNLFEDYLTKRQILSSLVLNPPYNVDGFTTAPKISKVLSLPFGLKIKSASIFSSIFRLIFSMSMLMITTCILILFFYLPLKVQNIELSNTAISLTNNKYTTLAKIQEESNYNRLFSNVSTFSLMDSDEIIHINNDSIIPSKEKIKLITFNKYPSIQFSGF